MEELSADERGYGCTATARSYVALVLITIGKEEDEASGNTDDPRERGRQCALFDSKFIT